jgi:hypothetical protein
MKCYIAEENKSLIKSPPAFNWERRITLFHDISLAHIDLLHKGSTEFVEFLVQ